MRTEEKGAKKNIRLALMFKSWEMKDMGDTQETAEGGNKTWWAFPPMEGIIGPKRKLLGMTQKWENNAERNLNLFDFIRKVGNRLKH